MGRAEQNAIVADHSSLSPRRRARLTAFAVVLVALVVPACGEADGTSACIVDDEVETSKVCVIEASPNIRIESSGLQPGSDFLVEIR